MRLGDQHSVGIFWRNRRGIPPGHPLQRRKLPRCHHENQHGGIRQDGNADPRHIRRAIGIGGRRMHGERIAVPPGIGGRRQQPPHRQSHYQLCDSTRHRARHVVGHHRNGRLRAEGNKRRASHLRGKRAAVGQATHRLSCRHIPVDRNRRAVCQRGEIRGARHLGGHAQTRCKAGCQRVEKLKY